MVGRHSKIMSNFQRWNLGALRNYMASLCGPRLPAEFGMQHGKNRLNMLLGLLIITKIQNVDLLTNHNKGCEEKIMRSESIF